jgi:hypothetical protein
MSDYQKRIETLNENDYVQIETIADCVELRLGCEDAMGEDGYAVILTQEEVMRVVSMLVCASDLGRADNDK